MKFYKSYGSEKVKQFCNGATRTNDMALTLSATRNSNKNVKIWKSRSNNPKGPAHSPKSSSEHEILPRHFKTVGVQRFRWCSTFFPLLRFNAGVQNNVFRNISLENHSNMKHARVAKFLHFASKAVCEPWVGFNLG